MTRQPRPPRSTGDSVILAAVRHAFAAKAYRGGVTELKNQKLRSRLERLANWLLTHDAENGPRGQFDFPFDKKVLAALGAYGVVVQGPTVVIRDLATLRKLAQPCSTIDGTSL